MINFLLPRTQIRREKVGWVLVAVLTFFVLSSIYILATGSFGTVAKFLATGTLLAVMLRGVLMFAQLRHLRDVERQAETDPLTGLLNRRGLIRNMEGHLKDARDTHPVSILVLDCDRFKEVNDSLGHQYGDEFLVLVGENLTAELPERADIARLGGDEFAIVLPDTGEDEASDLALNVRSLIAQPRTMGGLRLRVTASVGMVTVRDPRVPWGEALRRADVAMFSAKDSGSGQRRYRSDAEEDTFARLTLTEQLRGGLARHRPTANGYLLLHYQPQVALTPPCGGEQGLGQGTVRVAGVEALVRWQHPEHGLLGPDTILRLVDRAGLHRELIREVVSRALDDARSWRAAGHEVPVSANLDSENLRDPNLPSQLAIALASRGLPSEVLTVELTEATMMEDPGASREALARIQSQGIGVSIDDYGTGYSSLTYLHHLPVDELKVDRSFVQDLADNPTSQSIIRHTVALAHSLGLHVVAEGIEDESSLKALQELGADVAQGYLYARPMPAEALQSWLDQRTVVDSAATLG